jgi:hypothetical protein
VDSRRKMNVPIMGFFIPQFSLFSSGETELGNEEMRIWDVNPGLRCVLCPKNAAYPGLLSFAAYGA